jgi:hypothetical protein
VNLQKAFRLYAGSAATRADRRTGGKAIAIGRTVTPFIIVLAEEQARFKDLRRALRKEDQRRFDELFEFARKNVQAGVQAANPYSMASLLLLMLVEMLGRIEALDKRPSTAGDGG